jgi:DNA-binding CsgD family transcriptional regulator
MISSSAPSDGSAEDVMLDMEVKGVRCVLIRSHQKASRGQVALSPREQEIARMVAKGYPNKIIADVLDISSWTVCTHLRRMFAKLGVGSRAAMVARLLEEGTIGEHAIPAEGPHAMRRQVASK